MLHMEKNETPNVELRQTTLYYSVVVALNVGPNLFFPSKARNLLLCCSTMLCLSLLLFFFTLPQGPRNRKKKLLSTHSTPYVTGGMYDIT